MVRRWVAFGTAEVPYRGKNTSKKLWPRFPKWKYKALDLSGLDVLLKENRGIEVGPVVEYFDGGIVVDERLRTTLDGLFAAGECTLGPFGANRVCAATTEMLVHGRDAGRHAAEYAKGASIGASDAVFNELTEKAERPLNREKSESPAEIRRRIQLQAHQMLGPIRKTDELEKFQKLLDETEARLPELAVYSSQRAYNKGWIDILELENIVHLLKAAVMGALYRKESRGVHFREEFPRTDNDQWLKETIIPAGSDQWKIVTRKPAVTQVSLPAGNVDYLDMWKQMMAAHSDVGGHH